MSFLVRDSYKYLQEFFVRRYNVICEYDTHTNLKYTPSTFEEFVREFHSAIEHGLRLLEEDKDSSSSIYDARVLRSYLQTKDELNLGVGLIYNCSSKELERGEAPMIIENADDHVYAPTLESKDKDPLPSTSYKELQDRFTQKYNELYYPEGFTEEHTPKSFWEIIDSLHGGVNYARNCMEYYLKENRSEDDFTLCEYYAKVLDTYLRTKAELNLGILFVSDCDVRKHWSERNPMIVENADDYIYTPTLESKDKDPLPSMKKQTTRKPDEDMVDVISHGLRSFDLKYAKPFHPDEDLLIGITNLIFEWCETVGIDSKSAKYHILAELYSMMRRFVMLKSPEKKEKEN